MKLLILCVFAHFAVKVHGVQEIDICPRKEPPPGVLPLTLGSEVVLDCSGAVTVNGVQLVTATKQKERLGRRRTATGQWTTSQTEGDSTGKTGIYHSTIKNTGRYQNKTATGKYAEDKSDAISTVKTPTVTTQERTGTGQDFTLSQYAQPNRVRRVTEEGEAFSVTLEMGITTERGTNMEYEDYDDYGDNEEGRRVTRAIKKLTRWTRNGQKVRGVRSGGVLRLSDIQLNDSGNYSCYKGGRLISSVKISVGVPPGTSTLTCHKKFHTSKVRCEWLSKQPIIPRPQCYLLLGRGTENFTHVLCSYSPERSRCWCAMPSEEGDKQTYFAKICVANTAGSSTNIQHYTPQDILKPDPPAKVIVKAVKGQPHTLVITWSYPATWKNYFYHLQFELRYRPLLSKQFQLRPLNGDPQDLIFWIQDAMPNVQYEVQLRAKDEYDGIWSEWTRPVYARTWKAPEPTIIPDTYTSLEPFWTLSEGSGDEDDHGSEHEDGSGIMWQYVLWACVLCLFTISILIIYTLRHRVRFMSKTDKQSCASMHSSPPVFLQQPLMNQHLQHFLPAQEETGEGITLHNYDYFFSLGD
ncbi:interleukin-6 receptor subunit alpha [Hoplias malabaricus]|uniref:interleukin-6 receptor subunit alpha n=1 Tax=Hoplias malabaricus TaxID=27720 RepID=UPI003462FA1B